MAVMATNDRRCYLLEQPIKIIETVFSFVSYDEIARLRQVCRAFNEICQSMLNRGFLSVEQYQKKLLKKIKAQLPRRESERRLHQLARHSDILTAIETRLSLLGMTYMKYVEGNVCCFIPGKVLDEIYRILRYVEHTETPQRSHEILQELRDISSMAMEHFEEKIINTHRQKLRHIFSPYGSLPGSSSALYGAQRTPFDWRQNQHSIEFKMQSNSKPTHEAMNSLKKEVSDERAKMVLMEKKLEEQDKKIEDLTRLLTEHRNKLTELDTKLKDVNQKQTDNDRKLTDFLKRCSQFQMLHRIKSEKPDEPEPMGAKMTVTAFDQSMDLTISMFPSDGTMNASSSSAVGIFSDKLALLSPSQEIVAPIDSSVVPVRKSGRARKRSLPAVLSTPVIDKRTKAYKSKSCNLKAQSSGKKKRGRPRRLE